MEIKILMIKIIKMQKNIEKNIIKKQKNEIENRELECIINDINSIENEEKDNNSITDDNSNNISEYESQNSEEEENEEMIKEGKNYNTNCLYKDTQIVDFIKKYEGLKEEEDEKDILIEEKKDSINEENKKVEKFKIFSYQKKKELMHL